MANVIRVTPEELKSAAGRLDAKNTEMKGLTQNMTDTVMKLTGRIWSGEAQTEYINRFKGLEQDMLKLHELIRKHVDDLNLIANEYQSTETKNLEEAGNLSSQVIS
jgi:WXG100 family type VII secretion target